MLQKIIKVKNIGRFRDYTAAGDVTLRKVSLVFAENGRGKTTLCAILRSLGANQPDLIVGRQTLGAVGQAEVHLLVDTATVRFQNGSWDTAMPHIAVFDGAFVSHNVYAGDVVDTEQRRNLYRVVIGAAGVTLATRVNDLDAQIREKTRDITTNERQIDPLLSPGISADAFVALPQDADIDTKIADVERQLQAVQEATRLQQRRGFQSVPTATIPATFTGLLAKTLGNVTADAEEQLATHLAAHHMDERGQAWLYEGMQFDHEASCPFCGQDLGGSELIRVYQSLFSEAYAALKTEITEAAGQVEGFCGDAAATNIERSITQNEAAAEYWQQYCALTAPSGLVMTEVRATLSNLRDVLNAMFERKAAAPLEAVVPPAHFTDATEQFNRLQTAIAEYNAAVAAANAVVDITKRETETADSQELQNQVKRLRTQKSRHTGNGPSLCEARLRFQSEKAGLEQLKVGARQALDDHTNQVITHYGESINRYLGAINAAFTITTPAHNYRGGTPSTSYQIVINNTAVDLGDASTPANRPSFKNTLSAGDRSTLALAFFLAQLEQDPDRGRTLVVFDDPFSSLDMFRRNATAHQIYRCADSCSQVMVLSHEPGFLKLVWDRVVADQRKTLQMARVGQDSTVIVEWDIEKALQPAYIASISVLQAFDSDGSGVERDIIQKLRPVLESYCRTLYPLQFAEQDALGVIVGKIKAAGTGHPLTPIVDSLDEINLYCRRYHHGEGPNPATEPIDSAELHAYTKKTLGIVGCT